MKRIGLIGGLGPEATVDYYKEIINAFKNGDRKPEYPEIIIYSVNMWEFVDMLTRQEFDVATDYLLRKIEALRQAGAEFAAISANTPHILFDRLQQKAALPLISIVEATCRRAVGKGYKKPGLFGTGFTMDATFYQQVFSKHGITVVAPEDEDKKLINNKLFTEIELGIFKNETRKLLENIIKKMVDQQQIDSIILGCTEFPLILRESSYSGIPVLNTTRIHVEEIVTYCSG
ncbi:MAG: amino acid racemase [Bacteroidales bacterium]|nr:amino acid racemase [Bacteroidales bacterium]